jgi:ferredoxin
MAKVKGLALFDEDRCKGCELCTYVCPVNIIVMDKGILFAIISVFLNFCLTFNSFIPVLSIFGSLVFGITFSICLSMASSFEIPDNFSAASLISVIWAFSSMAIIASLALLII